MSSLETKLRQGSDGLEICSGGIMNTQDRKPQKRFTDVMKKEIERVGMRGGC